MKMDLDYNARPGPSIPAAYADLIDNVMYDGHARWNQIR